MQLLGLLVLADDALVQVVAGSDWVIDGVHVAVREGLEDGVRVAPQAEVAVDEVELTGELEPVDLFQDVW